MRTWSCDFTEFDLLPEFLVCSHFEGLDHFAGVPENLVTFFRPISFGSELKHPTAGYVQGAPWDTTVGEWVRGGGLRETEPKSLRFSW